MRIVVIGGTEPAGRAVARGPVAQGDHSVSAWPATGARDTAGGAAPADAIADADLADAQVSGNEAVRKTLGIAKAQPDRRRCGTDGVR